MVRRKLPGLRRCEECGDEAIQLTKIEKPQNS